MWKKLLHVNRNMFEFFLTENVFLITMFGFYLEKVFDQSIKI